MIKTRASVNGVVYLEADFTVEVKDKNANIYDFDIKADNKYKGTVRNIAHAYVKDNNPDLKLVSTPKKARFHFKVLLENDVDRAAIKGIVKQNIKSDSKFKWYPSSETVSLLSMSSTAAEKQLGITIANTKYDFTSFVNLGKGLTQYEGKKPSSSRKYAEETPDEHARYIIRTQPHYIDVALGALDEAVAGLKYLFSAISDEDTDAPSEKSLEMVNIALALSGWAVFRAKRLEAQIPTLLATEEEEGDKSKSDKQPALSEYIRKELLNFTETHKTASDVATYIKELRNYPEVTIHDYTKEEADELFALSKNKDKLTPEEMKRYHALLWKYKKRNIPFATEVPEDVYSVLATVLKQRAVDSKGAMILPTDTKMQMKNVISSLEENQPENKKQEIEALKINIDKFKEISNHTKKDVETTITRVGTKLGLAAEDLALFTQNLYQDLQDSYAQSYTEDVEAGTRAKFMIVDLDDIHDARELKTQLDEYIKIIDTIEQTKNAVENDPELAIVVNNPNATVTSEAVKEYVNMLQTLGNGETPERVNKYLGTWKEYLAKQEQRLSKFKNKDLDKQDSEENALLTPGTEDDLLAEYGDSSNIQNLFDTDSEDVKAELEAEQEQISKEKKEIGSDFVLDKQKYPYTAAIMELKDIDSVLAYDAKIPSATSFDSTVREKYSALPTQEKKNEFLKYFKFRKIIFEKLKELGLSTTSESVSTFKRNFKNLKDDFYDLNTADLEFPDIAEEDKDSARKSFLADLGKWLQEAGNMTVNLEESVDNSLDHDTKSALSGLIQDIDSMSSAIKDKDYEVRQLLGFTKPEYDDTKKENDTVEQNTVDNDPINPVDLNQGYEDKTDFGELNKQQDN